MMPGMDGLETAAAIRTLEETRRKEKGFPKETSGIPIIALTANAVSGVRKQFLDAGMNDFLSKPIILSELLEILQKHIPKEKIVS
jgi:CheY-like chemotaxis protein